MTESFNISMIFQISKNFTIIIIIYILAPIVVSLIKQKFSIRLYRKRWINELCELNSAIRKYCDTITEKNLRRFWRETLAYIVGILPILILIVVSAYFKVSPVVFLVNIVTLIVVPLIALYLWCKYELKYASVENRAESLEKLVKRIYLIKAYMFGTGYWFVTLMALYMSYLVGYVKGLLSAMQKSSSLDVRTIVLTLIKVALPDALVVLVALFISAVIPLIFVRHMWKIANKYLNDVKSKLQGIYAQKLPKVRIYTNSSFVFYGKLKGFRKDFIVLEIDSDNNLSNISTAVLWEDIRAIEIDKTN